MKCPRCGRETEKGWEYCPRCGSGLVRGSFFRLDDVFSRMRRQMKEMNRMFERDFEAFDLSPIFRETVERPAGGKAKGFRITMSSGAGREPRVSVQTFGEDKNDLKKEILEQLRMGEPAEKAKPEGRRFRVPQIIRHGERAGETERKDRICLPKVTEEPKTRVRRLDSRVVVDIEIPGVISQENIDVRELENSVEVKALAGDKAYFKILTKPSRFRLTGRSFEKGKLRLEFS